jgi:tetratricopeptide (TPR) repeat protein
VIRRGFPIRRIAAGAALLLAVGLPGCGPAAEKQGGEASAPSGAPAPLAGAQPLAGQPLVLPPEAARLVNEGVAEYRQGRYLEAAASFEKARDLVPADVRVSNFLGTALLQSKRYTPARAEFLRILEVHPEALEPRLGLARIGIRLGEYEEATTRFREVLSRDPQNLLALYNLGLLRYRAGDYQETRELLGRLLALKPDHPEAHYTLGLTRQRLGEGKEAEASFRKVVELAPEYTRAHFHLAQILQREGRLEEAREEEKIFEKLWDRQAADRAAEGKARDLYLAGEYEGALREYDRLVRLQPDSGRFELGRGQCFLKLNRRDEAIAAFEAAVAKDPRLPDAHFHLAVLYQQKGDLERSERERRAFEELEAIGENKTGF